MKIHAILGWSLILLFGAGSAHAASGDMVETATGTTMETAMNADSSQLTRASFTAMLVDRFYTDAEIDRCYWDIASTLPPRFTLVYADVHVNDAYAKHICIAMRDGLVRGYGDGSFKPDSTISLAEAATIVSRAYVLAPFAQADTLSAWFEPHLRALVARNAIPVSLTSILQKMTAGDLRTIMERLDGDITWEPARGYDELIPRPTVRLAPKTAAGASGDKKASSNAPTVPSSKPMQDQRTSSASSSSKRSGIFWNPF